MIINQEYKCQRPFNGTTCRYYIIMYISYNLYLCVPCRNRTALLTSGQGVISSTYGIAYIPTYWYKKKRDEKIRQFDISEIMHTYIVRYIQIEMVDVQ